MIRAGLTLSIFGGMLAASLQSNNIYTLPKLVALCFGVMLLWVGIIRERAELRKTLFEPVAALLLTVLAISTIGSVDWVKSLTGHYQMPTLGVVQVVAYILLVYGVAHSRAYVKDEEILRSVLGALILTATWGLLELASEAFWIHGAKFATKDGAHRISSTIGNPVFLGAMMAAAIPLALHFAIRRGRDRIMGLLALALFSLAIYHARSRGAIIAVSIAVPAFLIMAGYIRMTPFRIAVGTIVLALYAAILVPTLYDASRDGNRIEMVRMAYQGFKERPVFGTGPDTYRLIFRKHMTDKSLELMGNSRFVHFNAHNDMAQIGATMGVAGLAVYAFVLGVVVIMIWLGLGDERKRRQTAAIAAGLLAIFAIAKVNPIILSHFILAAVFFGILLRRPVNVPIGGINTFALVLVFVGSIVLASYSAIAMMADISYKRGIVDYRRRGPLAAAQAFNKAARMAPWELEYVNRQARSLFPLPMRANVDDGIKMTEWTIRLGARAVMLHPENMIAHQLYGTALTIAHLRYQSDTIGEAIEALDYAQGLAPLYAPLMMQRLRTARIGRDRGAMGRAQADLDRTAAILGRVG